MADRRPVSEKDHADELSDVRGALHDVSNALTVVLGWVAEAREPELGSEDLQVALRMIETHARKARDLARVTIGAEIPTPSGPSSTHARSVDRVVEEVLSALAPTARDAGVLLVVEGSGDQSMCEDFVALHHVLVNLVLNAIAHSPGASGRQAHVRLHVGQGSRPETIVIDVVDEGTGVPEELTGAIFAGQSTRIGGAGVGLAHSRSVARRAGGDVSLLSRGEAQSTHTGSCEGAVFRVLWPRSDKAPRPSASRVRGNTSLAGQRFLVVEDDPAVTTLLEAALEARGADVCLVRSHADLTAALAEPHDGAIVDLSPLEGHVSEAFAKVAAAARPGAPVVLATGSVDTVPEEILRLSPTIRLVRKPFELGEVLAALTAGKAPISG